MDFATILQDLVKPLCNNPDNVEVVQSQDEDGKVITLTVKADKSDLGHLIGRKGAMAQSIRSMMSIASTLSKVHLSIKFEANDQ